MFVTPDDLCTVVEGRRVVHLGAKNSRHVKEVGRKLCMLDIYNFPDWLQVRYGAKSVDSVACKGLQEFFFLEKNFRGDT